MSDVLIASTQVQDWRGPTSGVELRLALDQPITTPEGQIYGAFPTIVKRAACTITSATVNGILQYTLTVPALSLPATANASVGSGARYSASFWRTASSRICGVWPGFESFVVPSAPSTTTWGAISFYNGAGIAPFGDQQTFSRSEILSLLDSIAGLTNSLDFTIGAHSNPATSLISLRAGVNVGGPLLQWNGPNAVWEAGESEAALLPIITKGVVNAVNAVLDAGAVGDNLTDNTQAFLRAYNLAVSKGWPLYIPAGIYLGQLPTIAAEDFHIFGAGKARTIIKSSADAPIVLSTANTFTIHDVELRGSGAGSNQIGIKQTGITKNHNWFDLYVRDTGGAGIVVTEAFSVAIRNVETWGCGGVHVDIQSAGPAIQLSDCYVHLVNTNGVAYRFRQGSPLVTNCNGVDGITVAGTTWAIIGQEIALGDTVNSAAFPTFDHCNVESFSLIGLDFRYGSTANCRGVKIAGSLAGHIAARFSLDTTGLIYYPDFINSGIWDENTTVANGDNPSLFPHGVPIEATHIPPIKVMGRAGRFGSFGGLVNYYDTTTTRIEGLRFGDGFKGMVTVPDASYQMQRQGSRIIHVTNLLSATAVQLIWGGWLRPGEEIIVKDAAQVAATHNITITAASGSLIDGAGSKVINTNGGSVRLYSDGLNYWTF